MWKAGVLLISIVECCAISYGVGHPFTITLKEALAGTYWCQRRHLEAIDLLKEVLYAAKQVLGPNHPTTIGYTNQLGEWMRESTEEQDPTVSQGSQHVQYARRENEELENAKKINRTE